MKPPEWRAKKELTEIKKELKIEILERCVQPSTYQNNSMFALRNSGFLRKNIQDKESILPNSK